jgi:hypothetical protein
VRQSQRQLSREVSRSCALLLGYGEEIGRVLGSMIENSGAFCSDASLREDSLAWLCDQPLTVRL